MQQRVTPPTRKERVFAVGAIAYLLGTLDPFLNGLQPGGAPSIEGAVQGSALAQLVGALVYGTAALLTLRSQARPHLLLKSSPALVAFLLLVVASVLWSASPAVSLRRITGVLGCVVVAIFLASRFNAEEVVSMLAQAFAIAIVVSIALIVALPGVAGSLLDAPGGVWGHKNELGRAMVFSALVSCALLVSRRTQHRWWHPVLLFASLALIAVSRSAQAVLVALISLSLIWPLIMFVSRRNRRLNWRVFLAVLTTLTAGALIADVASESILAAIDRDATLTDRTLIWEVVTDLGGEQPWLGAGYGAFWTSGAAYLFRDRWSDIDHAHNGYVDLWLELGFVGLLAFAALLILAHKRAWDAGLVLQGSPARFLPAFLFTAMLLNTVGRVFPEHNNMYWTLLSYTALLPKSVGARQVMRMMRRPGPQSPT